MFIRTKYEVCMVAIMLMIVTVLYSVHETEAVIFTSQDGNYKTYPFSSQGSSAQCLTSKRRFRHHRRLRPNKSASSRVKKNANVCACTRIYCPVCTTTGISYANLCEYRCARSSNSDLKIMKNGRC